MSSETSQRLELNTSNKWLWSIQFRYDLHSGVSEYEITGAASSGRNVNPAENNSKQAHLDLLARKSRPYQFSENTRPWQPTVNIPNYEVEPTYQPRLNLLRNIRSATPTSSRKG